MRPTAPFIALALLSGCLAPSEDDGTSVGNPGLYALTAAEGSGVVVTGLSAMIASQHLLPCGDGEAHESEPGERNDGDQIAVGAGRWCGMSLELSDALFVELEVIEQPFDVFEVEVPVGELHMGFDGGLTIDQDSRFLLELGSSGWIDLGELDEASLDQDSWDQLMVLLGDRLAAESQLFSDEDGDGEISTAERENGSVGEATSEAYRPPDDDDERGNMDCGASGSMASLGLVLLLGLPRRRRRRLDQRNSSLQ